VPNLFVVVDVQAVENLLNLMLLTSGNAVKVPVFPEQITVIIVTMANTYSIKYVYIYINYTALYIYILYRYEYTHKRKYIDAYIYIYIIHIYIYAYI